MKQLFAGIWHSSRNKRIILTIIFAGFWISFGMANASDPDGAAVSHKAQALKTIIVDKYYPYTFMNREGKPDGFSVELAEAVARVMDMELAVWPDQWQNAVSALQAGEIDFLPMMAYSKERDRLFDFSAPHTIGFDAFFTRKDKKKIRSMDDLTGLRIIVMKNDQAHEFLKNTGNIKEDQLILIQSLPEGLRQLAAGEGDVALMPKLVGLIHIRDLSLANLAVSPLVVDEYSRPFSFAVREGNQELLEKLTQGLNIVKATGQYRDIYDKWFGGLEPAGISVRKVLIYSGIGISVFIVAGLFLLTWSVMLRRQVQARTKELKAEVLERRQAEAALRESEQKLAAVFNSMTEALVLHELVFDDTGKPVNYRIIDCNRAFESLTGISKEKAVGELATDVYGTEPPPYLEEYAEVALSGHPRAMEVFFPPMDKHFSISVASPAQTRFVTISMDITAIKQSQQIIASKNKELEQIIYVASHDLRSPLVNVDGYGRELEYGLKDLKENLAKRGTGMADTETLIQPVMTDMADALSHIRNSTRQMDALLKGLLKISRSGRTSLSFKILDMNDLVHKVADSIAFQIQKSGIDLSIGDLPACQGDEIQVTQVFANLLGNAVKFLDPDRPGVIRVSGDLRYRRCIYCVEDNGIGIQPEHREKIFDLFHRLDPLKTEGEGLGLTIVRQILSRLNGEVRVESKPGEGSRFVVVLPAANIKGKDS